MARRGEEPSAVFDQTVLQLDEYLQPPPPPLPPPPSLLPPPPPPNHPPLPPNHPGRLGHQKIPAFFLAPSRFHFASLRNSSLLIPSAASTGWQVAAGAVSGRIHEGPGRAADAMGWEKGAGRDGGMGRGQARANRTRRVRGSPACDSCVSKRRDLGRARRRATGHRADRGCEM